MRPSSKLLPRSGALLVALVLAVTALAPVAQAAPKRVVALTPFAANTIAGLGIRPKAIGETVGANERFASNLRGIKRLTLSHPNGPNMEELAILNPQLVLSSPTWAKGAKTMRDFGIKVVNADPMNIPDAYRQTATIGKLVGKADGGRLLAARLKRQVRAARRNFRGHPRTLVVLGVGRTPFVLLGNSWGGSVVKAAGAKLVTAGVTPKPSGFVRISDEAILKANPDVIIAIPHGNADDVKEIGEYFKNHPAWRTSDAVRDKRLYVSTDDSLLQAGTDIGDVIRFVRSEYLGN